MWRRRIRELSALSNLVRLFASGARVFFPNFEYWGARGAVVDGSRKKNINFSLQKNINFSLKMGFSVNFGGALYACLG